MSDGTGGGTAPAACPPRTGLPAAPEPAESEAAAEAPTTERSTQSAVLFRANCPHCRSSFELDAAALRLAIGGSSRTTFYSFTCPSCDEAVRKPAGERIVELLTGGGVPTMRLTGR